MSRFRSIHPLIIAGLLPVLLGGCAAAVVGGLAAAGGAGYEANQERGINGAFSDFSIKSKIDAAVAAHQPPLNADIGVSVYEGRVLLTGRAPTVGAKDQVQQIAGAVAGVRTIYNDIEIGPPETTWEDAKDDWITTRLRSELMLASDVRSVNYTIETADRTVYLIGSARSQAELDRATQIARYVPDVKRVVSYVEIRPGAPATAQSAPLAPQASGPAPGAPAAQPSAPIQVQRL